jgi:dipeptidyl aminopeptidase/acylaminoacyl peptidase
MSTFTPATDWVQALAFSPDGQTLAIGSRPQDAALWNVSDPAHPSLIAALNGHSSFVETVTFSQDGKWLVTGSNDHTLIMWRLR